LTAADVADALDLSKVQVLRLAHGGVLRYSRPFGEGPGAPYGFDPEDVELLRQKRSGEAGVVLDRVDIHAAQAEPTEDRNAATRTEWLAGIRYVSSRNGGTFNSGQVRPLVSDEARGHSVGALITGLVRSRRIEWTGDYDTLRDPRNRHAESPCKVYRVIGELA
jgi:hypothetical protein